MSFTNARNPLTMKLSCFVQLDDQERSYLDELARWSTTMKASKDVIREGDSPEYVILLLRGWAFRYKHLSDGKRQIMAFMLPGDLCDPHVFILSAMDHSIGLLSDASVAKIPKALMLETVERSPRLARALWWSTMVDEAILRHWLLNIGQRDAFERIAHLFCELHSRASVVGLVHGNAFDLPLTQEQLGDTMGLTSVHTNRILQRMRADRLITFESKRLTICDIKRLQQVADYNPNYLHLQQQDTSASVIGSASDASRQVRG